MEQHLLSLAYHLELLKHEEYPPFAENVENIGVGIGMHNEEYCVKYNALTSDSEQLNLGESIHEFMGVVVLVDYFQDLPVAHGGGISMLEKIRKKLGF